MLGGDQMGGGTSSNLRPVRDCHDLSMRGDRGEEIANSSSCLASYPSIDLIKEQRRIIAPGNCRVHGESQARQLSA